MSQRPYRPNDLYSTTCIRCGEEVEAATMETVCECGAVLRMEWPCVTKVKG